MILKQISEVVWEWYQKGMPDVKSQTFRKPTVQQMIVMAVASLFREQYYASRKLSDNNKADYSFLSPLLTVQRFSLSEPDIKGKRRADMPGIDLFRLPHNSHFTNMYPFAEASCGNEEVGEITQVAPGEENFYINNPDLKFFQFFIPKGQGIDTYNIPTCISALDIETTFVSDDADITMDVAYDAASKVLLQLLKVFDVTGETQIELREALKKQEGIK